MNIKVKRYGGRPRHVWLLLLGVPLLALPLQATTYRIYVTSSSGDTIDVVDPVTNKVVQVIKGIKWPHGVVFSPDGSRVYVTNESESILDVVDQKTGEIIKKVTLSGHPNNLAITNDGRRILVGVTGFETFKKLLAEGEEGENIEELLRGTEKSESIRPDAKLDESPGALDVIDTTSLERVKSIPMKGPLHNVYVTPDGKFAVMGSTQAKLLTVVDLRTEQPIWEIKFDNAVRNMAFEKGPDGSTRRIFVTTSFLCGFAVVDFAQRKVVSQIKIPGQIKVPELPNGKPDYRKAWAHAPSHGIAVTPDGKTLWVNKRQNPAIKEDAVYVYSLPGLKLLGHIPSGVGPMWITISPDGKRVYDSNAVENTLSVFDSETLKEVARIPVALRPARINTVALP